MFQHLQSAESSGNLKMSKTGSQYSGKSKQKLSFWSPVHKTRMDIDEGISTTLANRLRKSSLVYDITSINGWKARHRIGTLKELGRMVDGILQDTCF